jgi:hypothetical protein
MTFPAFRSPWDFPCQLPGPADVDPIKPSGIDQTCSEWITLRVPEAMAREIANRWYGGVGHIEVSKDRATELLRASEAWRQLNPSLVLRLVPDLVAPEPETVSELVEEDRDAAVLNVLAAREVERQEKHSRVEAALKHDPARTDDMIAGDTGCSRSFVRKMREAMEASGTIKRVPLLARAKRERPRRYQRRVAMTPRRRGRR